MASRTKLGSVGNKEVYYQIAGSQSTVLGLMQGSKLSEKEVTGKELERKKGLISQEMIAWTNNLRAQVQ